MFQITAPGVRAGKGVGLQTVVGSAQRPVDVGVERRIRKNAPARRAAFQIVGPWRRRRLERLERVKIPVVVVHGGVAGLIAADDLIIINPVRRKAADGDRVIGDEHARVGRMVGQWRHAESAGFDVSHVTWAL